MCHLWWILTIVDIVARYIVASGDSSSRSCRKEKRQHPWHYLHDRLPPWMAADLDTLLNWQTSVGHYTCSRYVDRHSYSPKRKSARKRRRKHIDRLPSKSTSARSRRRQKDSRSLARTSKCCDAMPRGACWVVWGWADRVGFKCLRKRVLSTDSSKSARCAPPPSPSPPRSPPSTPLHNEDTSSCEGAHASTLTALGHPFPCCGRAASSMDIAPLRSPWQC